MAKVNIRDRNKGNPTKKPNWEYRFEAARVNGKRHHISKAGFRTKKEALEAGVKALAEYNNAGLHFEPSEISFSDYMDYWYKQYCVTNLRYNTLASYAHIIEKWLKPNFGLYRLKSINPSVLQEFVNKLSRQGISSSYIHIMLSILKGALDYAVFPLEYIKVNPITYIRYPANVKSTHSRDIISSEDFERILKRFPAGSRFYIPLLLGWFCGLRIGETLAITWDDVDFDNKTLSINKQLNKRNVFVDYEAGEKFKKSGCCAWYFAAPKYGSSRVIRIGDYLIGELKLEKQRQEENEEMYGEHFTVQLLKEEIDEKGKPVQRICFEKKGNGTQLPRIKPICINENGELTTKDTIKHPTHIIQEQLNVKFDFHSLRHTHATMLIDRGVSPKTVQYRLGHKDVSTTLQIYTKVTDNMEKSAVEIFDEYSLKNIEQLLKRRANDDERKG